MPYLALKHLHLTFVALSFVGFVTRGILLFRGSSLMQTRLFKIGPHVVDTLLLISAVLLVMQWPGGAEQPWILAKVLGLVVYIGLGFVAFKRARGNARVVFWLLALLVFVWIVSVAFTKNPLGFFALAA